MFVYPIQASIYRIFLWTPNLLYSGIDKIWSIFETFYFGRGVLLDANLKTSISPKKSFWRLE